MWQYNHTDELYHYGVLGMKWGRRRYRRKDGTLTRAGRKRYGDNTHEDYKKAHDKKSVKLMSVQELRERNNRLNMEKQYHDYTKKTSKGKAAITAFIKTAGTITAVAAAYKTYKKFADSALDKVGDFVVSGIDLSGPWS
jgi:hypothetical protein